MQDPRERADHEACLASAKDEDIANMAHERR